MEVRTIIVMSWGDSYVVRVNRTEVWCSKKKNRGLCATDTHGAEVRAIYIRCPVYGEKSMSYYPSTGDTKCGVRHADAAAFIDTTACFEFRWVANLSLILCNI